MAQHKWTADILPHQSEAEKLCELIAEADAVVVGQPLMTGESVRSVTRSLAAAAQHPACPRR